MLVCFVLPQQAAAQNPATDVMVSIDDASVGEGDGSVTLTARLSRAVNQDVLLGITYQDGTATVLDDLRRRPAPPRLVTILANTLSTNFSVLIRNDTSVEPVETLTVSLGGISLPPDTNFVFSGSRATLTIIDNDNPPPPVNNPVQITDPQPIPEGAGHLNFVVTAKFNVNSDVVLGVAYAGGTTNPATPADDLGSDRPLTVTIAEGERRTTLRVPIIDDNFIEGNETFTVALSLPADNPPGQTLHFDGGADTTTATGTIIDDADDTPVVNATVGIGNASVAENGGNAEFTVSLTTAVGSAVTLAVAYTAGTATLATDLGTRPDTVTITADTTEATLLVPIANDNIVEGDEDFTVTISEGTTPLPEGVTIGTDDTGTGTITEDDEAEITLSTTTPTAAENGTFTYTVSLSNPADEAVTVRWTATDGTATVDDDLDEQTDTVTFNANDNTDQTFTIAVNDDDLDEDNETFTVTLEVDTEGGNALPTGVTIGTSNTATGTITDNDDPTGPDLTVDDVSVSSASVVEGVSFTINATVNNEGNAASAATTLTYYRSADATITTGDTSMATDPIGILAASGSSTQNASVSIATADTYYVGACVPTVSGETNTDNNCSTGVQVTVTAPAAPDLTVDSVSVSSASVVEGASFTINATVNNEGNAASAATTLTYYRSTDATITTGDTSMATDPIGILEASGSSTQNASVSIATADTYYVGACVPTVSGETDTDNNCSTGVQVTVTAPAAPDLTVDSVSVSSASVVEGASFTINATVNNEGNAASAATTLTYYLSADATITTGDTSIATDPIGILEASGSSTQNASVSIATADTYYVGACVPTVSGETDTDNNCSTGVQVTVTAATVAPAITTQPTDQSVTVGETATFTVAATGTPTPTYQWRKDGTAIVGATSASYTISSAAEADAGSYTVVVTSTAGTVTSTAATLTVTAAPVAPAITTQPTDQSVAVGGSATFTVAATGTPTPTYQWRKDGSDIAEATSATYTIASAALTDAGSYSVVVTNSAGTVTSTAATLTVTAAAPDLTVDSVSVSSASVVEGASFTINATVNNEGNAASAATTLTYYRSADATITTDDTSIATDPIGTLAANGSSTQNASVSIATADTYYVGACVPTVSGETNTDNNCSTGVQVTVTAAPPPPTVNISIAPASAEEGNNIRFTVTLSTQLLEQRTLDVSYTAGTGDTGASLDDLGSDRPATLTLPATGMTVNLDVPTVEDSDEEEDETFTVTLSLPDPLPDDPANTLTITTGTATGTITDDDTPDAEVSIGNASVAENGGNAEFTVSLTTAVDSAVALAVAYTAGTATLATDLGTRPDTVTITADTTEATLLVPITNDNIVEGDEDFTVTISEGTTPLPDGVTIGTDDTGTGTITEDDAGEITLSTTTPTAAENGTFTYTVSLSAAVDEAVTVRWTATDGTATVNNDLQETTNTVTFAANDNTAQEFTISPVNDNDDEDDETFTVTLSADTEGGNPLPTGVTIGTDNSSTATIIDNDDSPPPTLIDVSINDASAAEGTNIRFAVTLSAALIEAQTLNVAYTAGSASLDDLGSDRPTTLTLPTGTISVNLEVPTVDDNLVEDSESFTVTLSAVPPGPEDPPPADTLFLSDPEATGTITDNDRTPADDAMVRIGDMTVGEAAGNAAFTVTLSRAVSSPVVLDVTYADGTAEVTTDLGTPLPPTVTIAADTTEATVAVPIVDDDRVEGAETFTVTVSENRDTELPDGVTIADGEATGTIADNDVVPPGNDAQVRIGDVLVGEGAGPARLKVTLSRAVDSAVILDVTYADGSAAVPTDLGTPLLSTVTIAADTTEATIEVPIIDDDLVESVETFTVTLAEDPANPLPAGVSIGDDDEATATVSIVDDDRATVSIAPPTPSEDEGRVFNFTANLSTPVHEAVTVT